eukprot:7388570-Prymnesium_polylepis.1
MRPTRARRSRRSPCQHPCKAPGVRGRRSAVEHTAGCPRNAPACESERRAVNTQTTVRRSGARQHMHK